MVAPRNLPEPGEGRGLPIVSGVADLTEGAVRRLAGRWAALVSPDAPGLAARLAAVLRALAGVLRSEPFRPLAARELGRALVTGPSTPSGRRALVEDLVVPSLRLLREEGPAALGATGPDGARRFAEALDEMVAGYVGALHERQGAGPGAPDALSGPADHHLRTSYAQAAVGIALVALDGRVLDMNPALLRMLGRDRPAGGPLSDVVHPDDVLDVVERFRRVVRGGPGTVRMEVRLLRRGAEVLWAHVVGSRVEHGGRPTHLVAVVEDVSERHRMRSRLEAASFQDQLTRLPTRAVAEQWLQRAFSADEDRPERVGVVALDLDGFHRISDAAGRDVGDRLLLAVAGRLQLVAPEHVVARSGHDEFVVLVADPDGVGEVVRLADRLQAALAEPFEIEDRVLVVTASVGVAESRTDATWPAELLRAADTARGWATALGGGRRVVFDPERDTVEAARFALLTGLPRALAEHEFRLAYQPLVGLADHRLRGAEALVRWQHPEQGLIGPGRFIDLAEQSGAIVPLGRWVLETACRRAAAWRDELGAAAPYVSVNVSPVQLAEAGWLDEVHAVLDATGLPPPMLQLEITEQAVLGDEAVVLDALGALREAGVRLALDDFGTGYSSLAYLRRLPVHGLKIDGSFIDGLRHPTADPTDASIVGSLVGMAHALGLEVTAEWVETDVQADRLGALGCDVGQGRWFGDAGPAEWVVGQWRRSIGH